MDDFQLRELQNDMAIERQQLAEGKKNAGVFAEAMKSIGIRRIHGGEIEINYERFLDSIGEQETQVLGKVLVERLNGH